MARPDTTRYGKYTYIEYARFADDLVILIDAYQRHDWMMVALEKRLPEEFAELQVEINEEKGRGSMKKKGSADSTSSNMVRLHRVLAAKPDKVYR